MSELLLVVEISGRRVAFLSSDVRSVIELEGLTPVPRAPAHVAGMATLRSGLLTVIDCTTAIGLDSNADKAGGGHAAVVEVRGHPYALRVDRVVDVTQGSSPLTPPRADLGAGWPHVTLGIVETQALGPLLVVDPEAVVAGPQLADAA